MIEANRRGFLTGLISFVAVAPAIVRVTSLMPVRAIIDPYRARFGEMWFNSDDRRLYMWTGKIWEPINGKNPSWQPQGSLPKLVVTA